MKTKIMTLLLIIILAIAIAILATYTHRKNKTIDKLISDKDDLNRIIEYFEYPVSGLRRDGNTTRLADSYIQKLFNEKQIAVKDHHPTNQADEHLFKIILRRLEIEHPYIKLKVHKGFKKIDLV